MFWFSPVLKHNLLRISLLHSPNVPSAEMITEAAKKPDLARLVGRLLVEAGMPEDALYWLKLGTSGRTASLAYLDICVLHWQAGKFDQALEACGAGKVPAEYWIMYGQELEADGQVYPQAVKSYMMAILVDPNVPGGSGHLELLRKRLTPDEWISLLQPFVLAYPQTASQIYRFLGEAYLNAGQKERAIQVVSDGLRFFPDAPELLKFLASRH
jgi:tetratricopeptide (TPR) repeat protein